MLRTQIGGEEFRIGFFHEIGGSGYDGAPIHGYTSCTVKIGEKERPRVLSGEAFCSVKDTFCKEKGRKISLSRAIKNLPRWQRREVWWAYFDRKEHPKEREKDYVEEAFDAIRLTPEEEDGNVPF